MYNNYNIFFFLIINFIKPNHLISAINLSGCNVNGTSSLKVMNNDDHADTEFDSNLYESSSNRLLAQENVDENMAITNITSRITLKLRVLPEDGTFSPTALAAFVRSDSTKAKIYYTIDGDSPTLKSSWLTYDSPYLHIETPFYSGRRRKVTAVAVEIGLDGSYYRSEEVTYYYLVEGSDRPGAYGFLVPGVESSGYFLRVALEVEAAARAQVSGSQEFADFNTTLGLGPYSSQIRALHLPSIDPDLTGFEGGFSGMY
jgi:hypothetical protein